MPDKDIRWSQRFSNYKKALNKLERALSNYDEDNADEDEKVAIIKYFEMVYELAWNTIKDYYEEQGEANIQGSKDAFRLAFQRGLITDGGSWLDMVKSRRLSVHTYNQETADEIVEGIVNAYFNHFIQLRTRLSVEEQNTEAGS